MSALGTEVVWAPLPGAQSLALTCPCDHILFEGTRGRGATETQLMFFRRHVGIGYGKFWRGVIFDRTYKGLDDVKAKGERVFPRFGDGSRFLESKDSYKWVWPSGEELLLRQLDKQGDYWKIHGQEFPFLGFNELCKWASPTAIDDAHSCNRSSFVPTEHGRHLPNIPLVAFYTANPFGPGHNWVKRRFVDVAEPGQVVRTTTRVFNPRTQKREPITKTQVRIFGSYRENRFLAPEYIAELYRAIEPNKRKAWLGGSWDITSGGALDDLWCDRHKLPRFKIPASWYVDRSFDWGSTKPFSVGWWAEANGEEAMMPNGSTFCPPPGTLIRFDEWYGSEEPGSNLGLKLGAKAIAVGILEREAAMRAVGWASGDINPGPADNSIEDAAPDDESIAKKMADDGVMWTSSNKGPGSRKNGLQLIRDRLQAVLDGEGPGLYVTENCRAWLAVTPSVPRSELNPEDVDTTAEDHAFDETRYRVLAGNNRAATSVPFEFPR